MIILIINYLVSKLFDVNVHRSGIKQLDLQLHVQSVPITTVVVNSNPATDQVYSLQYYVIKFVSDFRQVVGILRICRFPPSINLTATI